MRLAPRLVRCALATAAIVAPGSAQAPTARAALSVFRDSLRTITDSSGINTLERKWQLAAKRGPDKLDGRLRLGFVQLRRGELAQNRGAFADAEHNFSEIIAAHRDWPAAWFGRGLARLNQIGNEAALKGTVGRYLAGDHSDDVAADLVASANSDALFVDGLIKLGDIAATDYDPDHLRAALLALRRVASKPAGANPAVQLARLRIERIAGSVDSAIRIGGELQGREPRDPVVLLEVAQARLRRGDESASADWLLGLALADSSAAQCYRGDLRQVLPDSVLRRFDATTGNARAAIVRRFLEVDEYGQSRSIGVRLREHYLRLDHARTAFALRGAVYRADAVVAFRAEDVAMDERGLVWVLHGAPDDHTYLKQLGAPPNESWRYKGDDGGELLFHFVKTDARGFRRVPSLFDILAMTKALQATGHGDVKAMAARGEAVQTDGASWTAQTVQDMLYSREAMSPMYGRILSRGRNGALELQREERAAGDSSMARGETRAAPYELPLDAQIDAVAVGSDAGSQLLQVAFAIPGTSLYAPPSTGPVIYPVRMRVSVIRRGTGEVVSAVDTVRNFVAPRAVPLDATLYGRLPVRVPAGDYTIRVALETPGRGVMSPRLGIRVAGGTSQALDLSDLALGARSVRLPWRTPRGDTLWVNPSRAFHSREPVQLYFEVMGVAPGTAYRTDLAIFRSAGQLPELTFGFSASATASPDAVHREVDIARLKPGSYQLQVIISTTSGERVVRRGEFTVIK